MLKPKIYFPLNSKYTKPNNSELTEAFKNSSISLLDWLGIDLLNGSASLVLAQNGTYVNNNAPGAPNNSIQYNNNGVFAGDALFTRDPITGETTIASSSGDITLASTGNGSIINTTQGDGTIEFLADGGASPVQFVIDPLLQSIKIQTVGIVAIGDEAGEQNSTHIQIDDTNETVMITNVPSYADDAAAGVGGLTTGMLYQTTTGGSTFLKIVP